MRSIEYVFALLTALYALVAAYETLGAFALLRRYEKFGAGRLLRIVASLAGTAGLLLAAIEYFKLADAVWKTGLMQFIVSPALAAESVRNEMAPFVPFIASGVIAVMALAFISAVGALLVLKDTPENQARIKAADNVVKTLGGFFTGLATTLLR